MAYPTYKISIFSDGEIQVEKSIIPPIQKNLFWVPHDKCRYNYSDPKDWRYNPAQTGKVRKVVTDRNVPMPEVFRLDPGHNFRLTAAYIQLLIEMNPEFTPEQVMAWLDVGVAFCNIQPFVFDQPRFMGGATVTGDVDGDRLWLKTLRNDLPAPSAASVLADQTQWFWCVSVTPKNTINYWMRKGRDGQLHRCRMFLIAAKPVYVKLNELKPVDHIIQDATAML